MITDRERATEIVTRIEATQWDDTVLRLPALICEPDVIDLLRRISEGEAMANAARFLDDTEAILDANGIGRIELLPTPIGRIELIPPFSRAER